MSIDGSQHTTDHKAILESQIEDGGDTDYREAMVAALVAGDVKEYRKLRLLEKKEH